MKCSIHYAFLIVLISLLFSGCKSSEGTITYVNDSPVPELTTVSPVDSSSDVPVRTSISVTFNDEMRLSTLTTNTIDVTCSGSIQVSADSFRTCVRMEADPTSDNDDKTFTVTPAYSLAYQTTYKIRINSDVRSKVGRAIEGKYSATCQFTTVIAKAITLFTFAAANNDALATDVSGTLNETAKTVSLAVPTGTTVTNLAPTIGIAGSSVSPQSGTAVDFSSPVTYTVTATDGTTQDYIATVTKSDQLAAPTINFTTPGNTASDVRSISLISVTFNKDVDSTTINASSFVVNDGSSNQTGTIIYSSGTKIATFDPSDKLSPDKTYLVTITTDVKDTQGKALGSDYAFTFNTVDLTSNLSAYYPFNNNTNDESLNSNDLTLSGGVTPTTDRKSNANAAFSFNGTNGYLYRATTVIPINPIFTVSVWAKTPRPAALSSIMAQGTTFYLDHTVAYAIRVGDGWVTALTYPGDGLWHHFVIRGTATDTELFIDGSLALAKGSSTTPAAATEFRIGEQYSPLTGQWWPGQLDDIRIYSRSLSDNAIKDLFDE